MYRHFYQALMNFAGDTMGHVLLWLAPTVLLLTALILGSRPWRRRIDALGQAQGRWAALLLLVVNFLRLAAGAGIVGVLCLFLLVEAGLFAERHGRVTQRNYDAVKSKWGVAHEQRELSVAHYVWQRVTVEEFAGGGSRRVTEDGPRPEDHSLDQEVLSDETFDVVLDEDGRPRNPRAVSRRKVTRQARCVGRGGIESADIDLTITRTPRYLGGAGYAGFEDDCTFAYTVANRTGRSTYAVFRFPLPGGGQGLFNELAVSEDGEPLLDSVTYADEALRWSRLMQAGEKVGLTVHYESRGLEYFRYWPGNLRRHYRVRAHLRGIAPERLNFPIGSMSPDTDLDALSGEDYELAWDLSNAVTNYSIGVIVPAPRQPGFEVARLLRQAPVGLALLAGSLVVTRLLLGAGASILAIGLCVLAHYLGYATTAHVSDLVNSFPGAFAWGMALPTAAGAGFWLARDRWTWAGVQSASLHVLFTLGYPLAVWVEDLSGTILHLGYSALAAYVMLLAVRAYRHRGRQDLNSAPQTGTLAA